MVYRRAPHSYPIPTTRGHKDTYEIESFSHHSIRYKSHPYNVQSTPMLQMASMTMWTNDHVDERRYETAVQRISIDAHHMSIWTNATPVQSTPMLQWTSIDAQHISMSTNDTPVQSAPMLQRTSIDAQHMSMWTNDTPVQSTPMLQRTSIDAHHICPCGRTPHRYKARLCYTGYQSMHNTCPCGRTTPPTKHAYVTKDIHR